MFEGHPSWRSIIAFYVKGLFLVLLACFGVAIVTGIAGDGTDSGLVALVAVIGVAVVMLAGFIQRITVHYTITTRRLHIKRGIIAREIQETRLERVQNVNYNQSLTQRLLQVGDVDFDTAAGDDFNFVFAGVANPDEVVERVDRATSTSSAAGLGNEPAGARRPGSGA
jgi:uncharacterized membrane protein YdbT with pleckstrin-like domain